ncbi:MAG TPA: 4Fe-4S binding protein [Firmicutes bacterium]|jgi:pyruvate ferredoxin oxidoreductase delta subunit|nr:4Fe-4S binding protein [Bacillota bacterium]
MRLNAGAVCAGGGSYVNKTGHWRTFIPRVDTDKCNGCGICYTYCPDSSIEIVEKTAQIDYDYCKGCGVCAHECPREAIAMEEERK